MPQLDQQENYDRYPSNFGFAVLPNYSFSSFAVGFSGATWLGRFIYVVTHLVGKLPFLDVFFDSARLLFSNPKSGIDRKKELQSADEIKASYSPRNSYVENSIVETAQVNGINDVQLERDYDLASILQGIAQAAEKEELQQGSATVNTETPISPHSPDHAVQDEEVDLAFAKQLQAELDAEVAAEYGASA